MDVITCCRQIAVFVLLIAAVVVKADEVTVDALLAKVPVLSPENEDLKSFQFTVEISEDFGVPLRLDVAWTKTGSAGVTWIEPRSRVPIAFIAEGQGMYFDVATGTIHVAHNVKPGFVLRAKSEAFEFGVGAKYGVKDREDGPDFVLDFPSFLPAAGTDSTIRKRNAAVWEVSNLSPSGESRIVWGFQPSKQWPLCDIVIRSKKNESVILAVRDVSINEPVDKRLQTFPRQTCFPQELRVEKLPEVDSIGGAFDMTVTVVEVSIALAAIHDKELRKSPLLGEIDWQAAARNERKLGPILRDLLAIPAP